MLEDKIINNNYDNVDYGYGLQALHQLLLAH